jgi:hypothetical protein
MGLLDAVEGFFTSEASGTKAIADWGVSKVTNLFGKDAGSMAGTAVTQLLTPAPPPKAPTVGVSGEDPGGIASVLKANQNKLQTWFNALQSLEDTMISKMNRDDLAQLVDLWQGDTGIYSKSFDALQKALDDYSGMGTSPTIDKLNAFNKDANAASALFQHADGQAQQIYQKIQDAWTVFAQQGTPTARDVVNAAASTVAQAVTLPVRAAASAGTGAVHTAEKVYDTGKADLEKAGSAIGAVGSDISAAFSKFIPYMPYIGGGLLLLFILPYLPKPHANPRRRSRR